VYDDRTEVLSKDYYIVEPAEGIEWDKQSESIHGISQERAKQEGTPLRTVLERFNQHMNLASVLIAHNLAFDRPVLMAEFRRLSIEPALPTIQYCTMDSTKSLCKIPPKTNFAKPSDPYKWPTLNELYVYLFGNNEGMEYHTANGDVHCLILCFKELLLRRLVPLEDWRVHLKVLEEREYDLVKSTASSATE
jgi:DNA polymerase III epsilon subunit-like protein